MSQQQLALERAPERLAVDRIIAIIRANADLRKPKVDIAGYRINVGSIRLRTFTKSITCSSCQIEGTFFVLERQRIREGSGLPYHLNLYGVDATGAEVLMTHDHVIPRSRGGRDHLDNTQTMCRPCNERKGSKLEASGQLADPGSPDE